MFALWIEEAPKEEMLCSWRGLLHLQQERSFCQEQENQRVFQEEDIQDNQLLKVKEGKAKEKVKGKGSR